MAPPAAQVAPPAEPPDLFASTNPAASRFDKYRLSHYFPGFGRPTAPSVPASPIVTASDVAVASTTAGQGRFTKVVSPVTDKLVASLPARPTWFGLRKPAKAAQTYVTDARPAATTRSTAEPAFLPIALQLPKSPRADRSVLPTSADVPDLNDIPSTAKSTNPAPSPTNPDASDADASPLSATEPRLAVPPIGETSGDQKPQPTPEPDTPPAPDVAPEPQPRPEPEPATITESTPATGTPADLPAEPPASDAPKVQDEPVPPPDESKLRDELRGRPRMPSASTGSYSASSQPPAASAPADDAKPAPKEDAPAAQVAMQTNPGGTRRVTAAPNVADPQNSLGLPPATVPASYSRPGSASAQASYQGAPQPQPVLASPQIAPSSQVTPSAQSSGGGAKPAKKTWHRPCLRRLIRRVCHLGEYANPPTAKPH